MKFRLQAGSAMAKGKTRLKTELHAQAAIAAMGAPRILSRKSAISSDVLISPLL